MLDIYIMTEQPVKCPKCGARTEIISEEIHKDIIEQICQCLFSECGYIFIEQEL